MRVTHWSFFNGSGLANVATDLAASEKALGLNSVICDTQNQTTWDVGLDADIHVVHSHIPDKLAFNDKAKIVVIQHGSTEHCFEISVTQGLNQGYGAGDSFSIGAFLIRRADAVVTFWPRQAAIWETMTDKPVYCIPMGVDRAFWAKQAVAPLSGSPSLMTAENCHTCKWPLDLFFIWPNIVKEFPDARIHALNVPYDQHKWWWPLAYLNKSHYTAIITATKLDSLSLRNFFSAASFYYSPVRYGDHNRVSLEAASCGAKVISFEGNEYSHFWIREGDQRRQTKDLIGILRGDARERTPLPVSDTKDTAEAMVQIYHKVLMN